MKSVYCVCAWALTAMVSISSSWAASKIPDAALWYIDPFDKTNTMRLDLEKKEVVAGDLVHQADFCPNQSEYHCFNSRALSFAVPRSGLEKRAFWEVGGKRYENKGQGRLKFAGHETEIFNITSVDHGVLMHFLYSPKSGLLAFGGFDETDRRGRIYLLQQAKGFGAVSQTPTTLPVPAPLTGVPRLSWTP